jgi:hypothetical protein
MMFGRFTREARAVVVGAQDEARALGHGFVGTERVLELALREAEALGHRHLNPEHVLLALVAEGEGVAGRVLPARGVTLAEARRRIAGQQAA